MVEDKRQQRKSAPPFTMVIFGASGDLTQRKLIPALFSLSCAGWLSSHTRIIGVGRTHFDNEGFREHLLEGVLSHARLSPEEACEKWDPFSDRVSYIIGDYSDSDTYRTIQQRLSDFDSDSRTKVNRLFHMAIPPHVYTEVVRQLLETGLNQSAMGWSRIVVEKPFGQDVKSARDLNQHLHSAFEENQIFRIDHYLGKETVQNVLALRFANAIFEPVWNRKYIDHVQITVAESVGIGDRGGYYDKAGVFRDMFQNHVMQLLTLTALEPPVAFEADTFRDEKVNILRAIRPVDRIIQGQYGSDEERKAYQEEDGVPSDSHTATFGALRIFIDNWRWRDVPFYLRSGKRLATKSTAISIEFNRVPHLMFPVGEREDIPPNILTLCIQPNEGIHFHLQSKKPGAKMKTHSVDIHYEYAQEFDPQTLPDAYERLLLDVTNGNATLFSRGDEIELAWLIMDPVLEEVKDIPCPLYPPGGWGPEQANDFINKDGRLWHYGCRE